jgi:hypothetical protein
MRVHKNLLIDGELAPNAFRDQGGGMSVNWDKYATAVETRRLAKTPADNGVIRIESAQAVRSISTNPPLRVDHTPDKIRRVRSHCEVFGDKTTSVRAALFKLVSWEIRHTEPVA